MLMVKVPKEARKDIGVLLVAVGVAVVLWGCLYPSFYIEGGVVTRKVTASVFYTGK
jgi:hypothetical protein